MASAADVTSTIRRSRMVFVSQLLLTGLAVAVSRLGAGRTGMILTLAVAGLNGVLVAWFLMGVRRERPIVLATLAVMLVALASMIFWIGWDLYDTVRRG
jgi:hypothetical protein